MRLHAGQRKEERLNGIVANNPLSFSSSGRREAAILVPVGPREEGAGRGAEDPGRGVGVRGSDGGGALEVLSVRRRHQRKGRKRDILLSVACNSADSA